MNLYKFRKSAYKVTIGEKGMSSDRNGWSFTSLEAHQEGFIWLGSSDSFHEAPRKPEDLYPGIQEDTHALC